MLLASFKSPLVVRCVVLMSAALEDSMLQYRSHDCTDRRKFVVTVCTPSNDACLRAPLGLPVAFLLLYALWSRLDL